MSFTGFVMLICCMCVLAYDSQPPCSLAAIKITMKSTRNKTGHWSSVVAMKQTVDGPDYGSDLWLVDVEQSSSTCQSGSSSLDTVINLASGGVAKPLVSPESPCPSRSIVPDNYELFPGVGYYKYHPDKVSWPEAHKACRAESGHLIILNSQEESNVAKKIVDRYPWAGNWFLTGILEFGVHKEYFTVFGEPLETTGFTQFYPGEDNARGPTDFGGMHRDGRYSDHSIQETFPFICEFDLLRQSNALKNAAPKTVPDNYELFPGVGYYKYHPAKVSWPQGHKACRDEGGHLIILNSQEESNVAKEIVDRYPGDGTWFLTGILEYGVHNEYFTIFGEPLETTGFTQFYPGQEDARGMRDFGGMHRDGRYSDVAMAEKYPFICEYDLND